MESNEEGSIDAKGLGRGIYLGWLAEVTVREPPADRSLILAPDLEGAKKTKISYSSNSDIFRSLRRAYQMVTYIEEYRLWFDRLTVEGKVITVNSMLKLSESFDEAQDERRFRYH